MGDDNYSIEYVEYQNEPYILIICNEEIIMCINEEDGALYEIGCWNM